MGASAMAQRGIARIKAHDVFKVAAETRPPRIGNEGADTRRDSNGGPGEEGLIHMKFSTKMLFWTLLFGSFLWSGLSVARAQNDPEVAIAKAQAELERQRIELDKKNIELQQKELELEKVRQEFQAQQSSRSLSINLSGDLLFDYDKAVLKREAEQALQKVSIVLSQFPESHVTVEGYTDSKGTQSRNIQLSRERAQAVKEWLVKNGGDLAPNISVKGFGELYPIAPNSHENGSDNPLGRALNRRVSIVVENPEITAER